MNKATVLFATTTVMLGATAAYLAHALMTERARHPVMPEAQVETAGVTNTRQPSSPDAAPEEFTAAKETVRGKADSPITLPPRVRNRTYSAAQLEYLKLQLQDEYPDLADALGFQPAEADAFFELIARQRFQEQEDARKRKSGDAGDSQEALEAKQHAHLAEQTALLGDVRAAEWNRYRDTLGSRAEVRELRMQLADSDYPLRRDQYDSLLAAFGEEEIRHRQEREQLHGAFQHKVNPPYAEVIEYFDKRLTLIEKSLARRDRAASSVLDQEQQRRYRQMLEHERQRAQAEYESFVTVNAEAARAAD